jgi:hypothetical protein
MKSFIVSLPVVVCSIIGGVLSFYDKPGWGWFLVLALWMFSVLNSEE